MGRNNDRPPNRVITITADDPLKLDRLTSELLDIIDSYGGTNPYPRFNIIRSENREINYFYVYSCTTKIATLNVEEFDKEIEELRLKID